MRPALVIIFLLLLNSPSFSAHAQGSIVLKDKDFLYSTQKDSAIWNQLNTFPLFKSLDPITQEFYYWVNLFRKDPALFYKKEVSSFLKQFPEANTIEARSLETDLSRTKQLPFLALDEGLLKMSKLHSADLAGRGGIISHVSADGKDFQKRINAAGFYRRGAENIFYGTPDALEALIILLLDHRVPEKGHRINLLDPHFNLMGASFSIVNSTKVVLVQEFGSL